MINDTFRAALIAVVQSLFPVLNILDVVSFTSDEISVIMLFITNAVTLIFLSLKTGQEAGPPAP